MRSGALAPDDAYRIFMQSEEYYNSTGATDDAFIAAVYERIIGRPAVAEEVAYWVGMLTQYGRPTAVNLVPRRDLAHARGRDVPRVSRSRTRLGGARTVG
jgi:hypothetical protein